MGSGPFRGGSFPLLVALPVAATVARRTHGRPPDRPVLGHRRRCIRASPTDPADEPGQLGIGVSRGSLAQDRCGRGRTIARGAGRGGPSRQPIGGAAGKALPLRAARGKELGRHVGPGRATGTGRSRGAAGPWRRSRPVTGRVPPRALLDRCVVSALTPGDVLATGRRKGGLGLRRWLRGRCDRPRAGSRGLTTRPLLEDRADREGARQAVRLLVRQGARRGLRDGEAAVSMIRPIGPFVAIVLERHERTGRGTIRAGQPTVRHRGDDTRATRTAARLTRRGGSDTSIRFPDR